MSIETPAARATDPVTSHEAAEHVTRSGIREAQQRNVRALVQRNPGCTSRELSILSTALDRYQIARRLPELETARRVTKGLPRVCTITGRRAVTWWPAD